MSTSNCNHPTCNGEICRREAPAKKQRMPIKRTAIKKKAYVPKEGSEDIKAFFDEMMAINEPMCKNCGSYKPHLKAPYYKFLWKSCQAHILPKRNFSSIATHPLNIIVLGSGISGMCHCHDIYDAAWSNLPKMPIWDEVVRRFKVLYPLTTPEEHQFIPQILLDTLCKNEN